MVAWEPTPGPKVQESSFPIRRPSVPGHLSLQLCMETQGPAPGKWVWDTQTSLPYG